MKHSHIAGLGLSLLLSAFALVGCGGSQPASTEETPAVGSTSDTTETPDSQDDEPSASVADNTESVETPGATAINPPKAAALIAEQANAQINLRSQPTTASESRGYGLVGDSVKLLRAAEGEGNLTWYYVKFDESGAEGWIRGDFIDTRGATASISQNVKQGASVDIDAFTTDEIFRVGSGGCGMTLWPENRPGEYILFNGLPDTAMWMKLDGDMTQFRRTAASGPEFYGQSASQSFVSVDGDIEVNVTASVGSEEGYESVNIEQGTLRLQGPEGGTTEVAVVGDAGC